MSAHSEDFENRRRLLSSQIARQRGELADAFQDFAKPLQYVETGLKGFTFLRRNQWLFMALPTTISVVLSLFGLKKQKPTKRVPGAIGAIPNPGEGSKSFFGVWGGRALQVYQLYRRLRPFFL